MRSNRALDGLRLSLPGQLTRWRVPHWMKPGSLSYHGKMERWATAGQLHVVSRGQEFVVDTGNASAPREWVEEIIAQIES